MEAQLFEITQNAIIKNSAGGVLILRHAAGKWLLPGGKINRGETWMDGLTRELKEELAVSNFKVEMIVDVDSWIENNQGYFVITYLVELPEGFAVRLSDEHSEYVWARLEDLGKYEFWYPKISERIKKVLQ